MEVQLWRPAENAQPQPSTVLPDGRMCREYQQLASTTALSIDRSSSSSVTGFDRVSMNINAEEVPAGTILRVMHIEGTILYQKQSAGPSEQPAAEDVCIPGTNSANDDFPLIYVEAGKGQIVDCMLDLFWLCHLQIVTVKNLIAALQSSLLKEG